MNDFSLFYLDHSFATAAKRGRVLYKQTLKVGLYRTQPRTRWSK